MILTNWQDDLLKLTQSMMELEINSQSSRATSEDIMRIRERREKERLEQLRIRDEIINSETLKQKVLEKMQSIKESNISMLQSYGIKYEQESKNEIY